MRNTVIGITIVIMLIISILCVTTVNGQNARQNEVDEALAIVVEQALDNVQSNEDYTIDDVDEMVTDFIAVLSSYIESSSSLDVMVLDVDYEKKAFDVLVTEEFNQPNGSKGTATCRKTVLLDSSILNRVETLDTNTKQYGVRYLVPTDSDYSSFVTYKKYSISEGSNLIAPSVIPELNGKTFLGWSLTKPTGLNSTVDLLEDTQTDKIETYVSHFESDYLLVTETGKSKCAVIDTSIKPDETFDGILCGLIPNTGATDVEGASEHQETYFQTPAFIKSYLTGKDGYSINTVRHGANGYGTGTYFTVVDAENNQVAKYAVVVYGDVNGDGSVTQVDVSYAASYKNGNRVLDEIQLIAADVNFDGVIDADDYNLIESQYKGEIENPQVKPLTYYAVFGD